MTTKAILTALAIAAAPLAIAAPAAAQSAGHAALAAQAGVLPGALSTSDLILLRRAIEDNDFQRRDLILDRAGRTDVSRSSMLDNFTASERVLLERAQRFLDDEPHRNAD